MNHLQYRCYNTMMLLTFMVVGVVEWLVVEVAVNIRHQFHFDSCTVAVVVAGMKTCLRDA